MNFPISKGADRPIEMIGLKGMYYIGILITVVGVGLVIAIILNLITGYTSTIFISYAVICLITHMVLSNKSRKHGEKGADRELARKFMPGVITVRSSKVYTQLRRNKK